MFNAAKDKAKDSLQGKGWLGKLLYGLLLTITNPQLIQTISDAISKYLNFETISKFITDTWDDIKEGGSKALDWVIDKVMSLLGKSSPKGIDANKLSADAAKAVNAVNIPANSTVEDAKRQIPVIQGLIAENRQKTSEAYAKRAALLKDGKPVPAEIEDVINQSPIQNGIYNKFLKQYQALIDGGGTSSSYNGAPIGNAASLAGPPPPAPSGSVANAASMAGPGGGGAPAGGGSAGGPMTAPAGGGTGTAGSDIQPAGGSKPVPLSTVAATGGSSVAAITQTSKDATSTAKTEVAPAATPVYKDGVTIEENKQPAALAQQGGAQKQSTTNSVSIHDFGFNSGDDSLNALNMGMMS
jgi:hypothetical protein